MSTRSWPSATLLSNLGSMKSHPASPVVSAELAAPLWRGVDAVHFGARPMFAAHRELPRPEGAELCVVGMARSELSA